MTRQHPARAADDAAQAEIIGGEVSCGNGSVRHDRPLWKYHLDRTTLHPRRTVARAQHISGKTVRETIAAEPTYPGVLRPVVDLLNGVIKMPLKRYFCGARWRSLACPKRSNS